jgi:SAM-dependent methyltransferase
VTWAKDKAGLLRRLREDGAYGCLNFEYEGIGRVSRDLMDSVIELNFLERHLGVLSRTDLSVLDIGAGYGRMAHRTLEANPRLKAYTCADAVPESTFLCEYYLGFRGLRERVQVLPLHELESRLPLQRYDLALNLHSFSECTYAAIEWWLTQLARLGVRHLMLIPNEGERFLSVEPDGTRRDFAPLLSRVGYREIVREPLFGDPAVRQVMDVADVMFLFQLQDATT